MADQVLASVVDALEARYYGKYRGVVQDNADSLNRGRLQVTVPGLLGDEAVWALPCVPYAGNGVGLFNLPPKGAGVWVEFEGGHLDQPIWSGCFWADNQISPSGDAAASIKFLKTDAVTIRIDDSAGEITIETQGGAKLKIGANEIELSAGTVKQSAQGSQTQLTPSSFDVNNGAFTVV